MKSRLALKGLKNEKEKNIRVILSSHNDDGNPSRANIKQALRENTNGRVNKFTKRIKGMHVLVGNFTYVIDFMIIEDISSIIDPRLSQVVLGRPFVEISNMTHDPPEGVIRFTNETDEIAYKMPHKIERYNSLSDLEREHTKSVYLRNEKDKRRGVKYVMSKILGFYKECLELGLEYVENSNLEEHLPPVVTMADNRTMAELLRAPTKGYAEAIVVPSILAEQFKLKHRGNLLERSTQDVLMIIRNKSKVRNSQSKPLVSQVKACDENSNSEIAKLNHAVNQQTSVVTTTMTAMLKQFQATPPPAPVKAVEEICVSCGGAHPYYQCLAAGGNTFLEFEDNVQGYVSAAAINYNQGNPGYRPQGVATHIRPPGFAQPNTQIDMVKNELRNEMKTSIQTSLSNQTNEIKNMMASLLQMNTASTSSSGTLPSNTVANPKGDLKEITTRSGVSYDGPSILPPVVENKPEATKDIANPTNNGTTEDVQPQTLLNEHCSAVLLKKLPEKLGDPGKILIPCDFLGMAKCLALADLGASINLMPYSVWKKLSLPELTPTCMTLKLADRSISQPIGVAKHVYVKVGSFHILTDFVVVDFDADPRVPLILERSFLKTERDLIDVFEGELTLRVGKEAITFNLDQTSRYSANYNDITAKCIDVIDMACEEYSLEVFGFFDTISSGNPTPCYDSIVFAPSPPLTPFRNSDFLLEEVDAFLAIEDKTTSTQFPQSYLDPEGGILLLEAFLNDDPSSPPSNQRNCDDKLPVIIAKDLSIEVKTALITVLKSHKQAIAWKLSDIKGINLEFCTHKILLEEDFTLAVQHQKRVNPKIHNVIKQEGISTTVFLMFFGYFQIPIDPKDQEKTTFNCPYGTFAYRRMPFGLCNAPGTFQKCMMAIFHDMIKKTMEVFMDDFSVFRNSFQSCLSYLEKMLKRCEDTHLCLNWEKSHFMVKEGIVLGHKISEKGIEVDKAKIDVISKLPHPTTVKGIRSFLGHAGFYRRFIKDFSKIARPMTRLLEKDTPFIYSQEYVDAFQTLKRMLTETSILIAPDWDMPFELMCDASDFAIGVVLGQRRDKHFRNIHYASKTMTEVESKYTTTEKEMLTVIHSIWSLLVVENSNLEEHLHPVVTMADNRTMAEMLRAPTEGYAEAIVVPPILAKQFKLKHSLINMMTTDNSSDLKRTIRMITSVGSTKSRQPSNTEMCPTQRSG
nr:reverse transcriptase domain-containing protein [Tanacetum cinerariifolium]